MGVGQAAGDGGGVQVSQVGIVVDAANLGAVKGRAGRLGCEVVKGADWRPRWERTLFISGDAGRQVPWGLLGAGFHFLERWDAAAPLWRYGVLAETMGTAEERERTLAVTLDLRLLPYEPGLLFVRDSEAGRALLATWRAECRPGDDERLAFLRALHLVKPLFCALPRSWLAEEERRSKERQRRPAVATRRSLTTVEIAPGRLVKCFVGDEDKVRAQYAAQMGARHGR